MSSFKRKATTKQGAALPGTKLVPGSSTIITSTGIPSLDDLLGGGLPLSCSLLISAPDPHSSYAELVQKYFIAQGVECSHTVCIIHENAGNIVRDCMWNGKSSAEKPHRTGEEDLTSGLPDDDLSIAWRYKNMRQFQTTVKSSAECV